MTHLTVESPRFNMPYKVYEYANGYNELVFFKSTPNNVRSGSQYKDENETKLDCNLSRARNKIFEYSCCNTFDWFGTFTLDRKKRDRFDLEGYTKDFTQMIRNERRKGQEIDYLLVPERHKDGAFHMHGLIKGISPHDVQHFKRDLYNWIPYQDKFGYSSIQKVRNQIAVSKYVTKYITKSMLEQSALDRKHKKLFYTSRGLNTKILKDESTLRASRMLSEMKQIATNDYVIKYELTNEQVSAFILAQKRNT